MRSDPDDPSERYLQAARWYLPPMAGESEPDATLACTYVLLAVYAKLDRLIGALFAAGDAPAAPDPGRELNGTVHALGWKPPREIRKGLGHN